MIFLYIVMLLVMTGALAVGTHFGLAAIKSRNTYGLSLTEAKQLSWPARQVIVQYLNLPEANRPHANIQAVVKALDTKHTVEKVNAHFIKKGRGFDSMGYSTNTYTPSWACGCVGACKFQEYRTLHTTMTEIEQALAEQEYAMALAGVQTGLDAVAELTERLREEKKIIHEVTVETRKALN